MPRKPTGRPPGRPRGGFDQGKERLYQFLKQYTAYTGTSEVLATKLECSERQVKNYLKGLLAEGRIRIEKIHWHNPLHKHVCIQRTIFVEEVHGAHQGQVGFQDPQGPG